MNNTDTIKAVSPIVNSFFRDEVSATTALDLIGRILKENSTANPEPAIRDITITTPEMTAEEVAAVGRRFGA